MSKFIEFDQCPMYDINKSKISVNCEKIVSFCSSEFFDPTYGKKECTIIRLDDKSSVHVTTLYADVKRLVSHD